jgi:hypothetical protein
MREIVVPVWPRKGIKPCPECGTGTQVARHNRKTGKLFAGCSRFPECRWARKSNYGRDYGGCSVEITLDPEKVAQVMYGVELASLPTGKLTLQGRAEPGRYSGPPANPDGYYPGDNPHEEPCGEDDWDEPVLAAVEEARG